MSRLITISKIGACTKVAIADTECHNEVRYYNRTCNLLVVGNVLVVSDCAPHRELKIKIEELVDLFYQTTVEGYADVVADPSKGFFNANISV
jgi:hypothetical protein